MDFDNIDEKTAFKLGFAQKCFEMGFEPEQVKEAMEKSAVLGRILPALKGLFKSRWIQLPMAAGVGVGAKGFLDAAKDWGGMGLGLAGAGGLLGGAALGYGKARLDEEDVDEDEIKSKELADTYKVYADRLKAQKAYQQYRQARNAS
jgi:hypothetical protein